ncbi:Hypothetical Protein FCC1311_065372 [Hondaea fermentalgiana]|uniref:CHK kinase-like domain-containing protein n=1 Tax=Hondaea fermentalgiana TaxID=2315210 RepID=A0A2R5GKR2_9STRA|nr:Hypothetical Protein FCC1311_065372 [Hondaea fermentalgiana]|eukprot:GBG30318.1 Hypothetical Protein FCC1311_065372 [Hondaea fermentalgiana]
MMAMTMTTTTTVAVAFVAAAAGALLLSPGVRRVASAAGRFLLSLVTLMAERHDLAPQLTFPRGVDDLWQDPERLFVLIEREGGVPRGSTLETVEKLGDVQSEPDKAATTAALRFVYKNGEEKQRSRHHLDVFVKFQSGRGMPVWLQAIRAAVEPGVAREVDFYRKMRNDCALRTARVLFADKHTWVNRVCIVLEYLSVQVDDHSNTMPHASGLHRETDQEDGARLRVIPDSSFRCVDEMRLMVRKVAAMHAMFWGRAGEHPASSWLPRRKGIEFAGWALSLAPPKAKSAEFTRVFQGINVYFAGHALTVVHGDCRPGNMIFEGSPVARDVIFSDFEAVNIAPAVWDVTYAIILGLSPEMRRANQDRLLHDYVEALSDEIAKRSESISVPTFQELQNQMLLLTVILFYVSFTVTTAGFWQKQGNTRSDLNSWGTRVLASLLDVDTERAGRLLGVGTADIEAIKKLGKDWAVQHQQQETQQEK